jgi:oxygen-independent coproporphyrinogen-3 oxidase
MLNALRLAQGFSLDLFASRTGLPFTVVEPALRKAEAGRLIERDANRIRATEKGRHFLDDLVGLFLPHEQ